MNGADVVTLEAVVDSLYEDNGASCSDAFDGQINSAVSVNGANFPSLDQPGVYTIQYYCTNSRGVPATPLTRTITIVDTTCPTCALSGAANTEIEASFPYTDMGADCTDTLDGTLLAHEVGLDLIDVEQTGTYVITYTATDQSGNTNNGCTHGFDAALHLTLRTVEVMDTLKPVIGLQYAGSVFHIGDTSDTGKNGENNPTVNRFTLGSPALMAFGGDLNSGWLLASVVCAVAGVAMLVKQTRRNVSPSSTDLIV
jgi:hypothetical protein